MRIMKGRKIRKIVKQGQWERYNGWVCNVQTSHEEKWNIMLNGHTILLILHNQKEWWATRRKMNGRKTEKEALKLLDHSHRRKILCNDILLENTNVSMTNFIFAMTSVYWSRNITNTRNLSWQFRTCAWHPVKPNQAESQSNTKYNTCNIYQYFVRNFSFVHLSIVVLVVVVVVVWDSFFSRRRCFAFICCFASIHRFHISY